MHGDENWTLYNPDLKKVAAGMGIAWRDRAVSFRAPFRKPRRDR